MSQGVDNIAGAAASRPRATRVPGLTVLVCALAVLAALLGCVPTRPRKQTAPGPAEWLQVRLPGAPQKLRINAIGGTGPDDIWAVGGGIYHWDGASWSKGSPPKVCGSFLTGLSVVARDDVWAVGPAGCIVHFDGSGWSGERLALAGFSTPGRRNYYDLLDVAAWPGEVWVTASKTEHYHYHVATNKWTVVPNPALGVRTQVQVWGLSPTDVWLPGGRPAHYTAGGWDAATVLPAGLREVHGAASDDVWLVGWMGGRYKDDVGAVFHFDGKAWTESPIPAGTALLWNVHAASSGEAYAVGNLGWSLVWNGTTWRGSATGVTGTLRAVYSPGGGQAFAGGDIGPFLLLRK